MRHNEQLEILMIPLEPYLLFIFTWFSLKIKTFQGQFCRKQTLLPAIQHVKTCLFAVQLIHVKNVLLFNVLSLRSVRNHFYVN